MSDLEIIYQLPTSNVGSISDLTDVLLTSIGDGELLVWATDKFINRTLAEAGISAVGHAHTESDITDLGTYSLVGHAHNASDVTAGQLALARGGSASDLSGTGPGFLKQASLGAVVTVATLAASDIPALDTAKITSGTFADARISESSVTQHEAALTLTESQIVDLGTYLEDITGESINDLSDVTLSSIGNGEVLVWVTSEFINRTLAEAGISAVGHTHSASDVTDFASAVAANAAVAANTAKVTNATHTGEVTGSTGLTVQPAAISNRTEVTVAGADHILIFDATDSALKKILASDFAAASHTHTASAITDFSSAVAGTAAVTANTAKVSNATHTGEVTGSTGLTLDVSAISNRSLVTAVGADTILIIDATDGALKKALLSDLAFASHSHAASEITSGTFDNARISQGNVTQHQAAIDHDALSGFVANEHIDHTSVTLTAGNGLTGGGDISASRSFAVGAGVGISVGADAVAVDINGLTEESGITSGDFLMFYDVDAATIRKIDVDDLPSGGSAAWQSSGGSFSPSAISSGDLIDILSLESDGGIAIYLRASANFTTGKLVSIGDNQGSSYSEKAFFDVTGALTLPGIFALNPGEAEANAILGSGALILGNGTDPATIGLFTTSGTELIINADLEPNDLGIALGRLAPWEAVTTETIRGPALDAETLEIQAYDADGTAYVTFITLTAGDTPTADLADSVTKNGGYIYRAGGTDVPVADGGSGASTLTGILQGNGTSAFTANTSSTVGQVLRCTGANTFAFGALDLADTDAVTGLLPITNIAAFTRIEDLFRNVSLDTTGDAYFEPYSILATNDSFRHMILRLGASNSAAPTVKAGFYGCIQVPPDFNSSGTTTVEVHWTTTLTSGNVVFDFDYRSIGGDDAESLDQSGFVQSVTVTDGAPSAAHERQVATLTLTSSNIAANDTLEFFFGRDGADGSDTLAGSAIVHKVIFKYTT